MLFGDTEVEKTKKCLSLSVTEESKSDDWGGLEDIKGESEGGKVDDVEIARVREDLEQFKREMNQVNAVKDHLIVELRSEQAAFLEENLKLMERFDNVDWDNISRATTLATDFK